MKLRRTSGTVAMAMLLSGCSGGSGAEDAGVAAATAATASAAQSPTYDRASFVMCDALEPHREELSRIIGFEQDASRSLALGRTECTIHGPGGAFVRVKLPPALIRSIQDQASSFDGPVTAVPDVGPGAVFVANPGQPHVVFSMGSLVIDVDAEGSSTPDRETMVRLATRVRQVLTDANQ